MITCVSNQTKRSEQRIVAFFLNAQFVHHLVKENVQRQRRTATRDKIQSGGYASFLRRKVPVQSDRGINTSKRFVV